MKASAFLKTGGPEVLEYIELPDPIPEADEVIVQVKSIGVNFADIYRRRGEYPSEPPSPFVLGHEGAGLIYKIGNAITDFSIGDRVAFAHVPRSNAEFVKAPAWKVIHLPDAISFDVAASVLLQGLTAHYLTHDCYRVKKGDTVLVHAASGGVGQLLIQICKILGAETIGTVSHANKIPPAKVAGADHVVVRAQLDWKKAVLDVTDGVGVDAGFDAIGSTLNETLQVVRQNGTAVYYGWAGGPPPHVDPQYLMGESKSIVGGELWSHIANREALLKRVRALFNWISEGKLRSQVTEKYHLADAEKAHLALEGGTTTGKIILNTEF